MSVKVMGLVWDLLLPPNEKLVLLAYADHADHNGFSIYPAVSTVAEKTGYSERSIQMITRSLEEKKLLVANGSGPKGTNRWSIPIYGGEFKKLSRGAVSSPPQSGTQEGCSLEQKGVKPIAPEPSLTVIKPSSGGIVFKAFESNIHALTPIVANKINFALEDYEEQWILDAIGEAVKYNARNWAYIDRVLKNWKAKGRSNGKPLDKMDKVEQAHLKMGLRPAKEVMKEMGIE